MSQDFYRALEEKFRGSREEIKSRLHVYLPFARALFKLYSSVSAVDLGCGRGEWLELLDAEGIEAQGIDLDGAMLESCHALGLRAEIGDAISLLKRLPDESQCIVSGFHIAEHLAFADLQTLVQESLRVLKPAGLLILETPNPENIAVGTSNFYLDPTHQRPLPPLLLAFLPEHYGFGRVKTLRLQEWSGLASSSHLSLLTVLPRCQS
ncbi:class I SAM-dependent methyltransferase [Polaromonas sp. P2-4]|nr:class I SAM-dependent methyltransferase [Polaromonas sp. P2-4]